MISFFSVSKNNNKIYSCVSKYLEEHLSGDYKIITHGDESYSQAGFLISLFRDDAVIVDCTIPEDLKDLSVYPILVAQINMLDHVLVVSETELPINLKPLRLPYLTCSKANEGIEKMSIAEWLNYNLDEIKVEIDREGRSSNRINVSSVRELSGHKADMERIQSFAMERTKKRVKEDGKKNILISYRSRYFFKDINGNEIPLKDRIHPKNYTDDYKLHIFEPQSLCSGDEILTPMRRWMLVGMLDDRIRLMDEVWIYYTPDYFESWWTISELVAVSYFNETTRKDHGVIVRLYNPESGLLIKIDLKKELNLDMGYVDNGKRIFVDKMARLMANTRPDIMAPEARPDIKQMKSFAELLQNSPRIIRNLILRRLKKAVKSMGLTAMPGEMSDEDRNDVLRHITEMYSEAQNIIDFANDEVFSDDFWYKLSYDVGKSQVHLSKDNNDCGETSLGEIDLKAYFDAPMNGLMNHSENELLEQIKECRQVHLLGNNGDYIYGEITSITKLYLWNATRMGLVGGKDSSGLEPINVFHMRLIPDKISCK